MTGAVGEWVFRHAGGCLIDIPDLSVPVHGQPWRWVATVWPDQLAVDGWAALEWEPGERGWRLPFTLTVGDIIEVGVTGLDPDGAPIDAATVRWYGWLQQTTDFAVIVVGPYRTARQALLDAQPVIDEVRLDQLHPPIDAILESFNLREPGFRQREP